MRHAFLLSLSLLFLFLSSCAKTNSENIKTSGFYATYKVVGNNENSVTCSASFQVSAGGTYIDLNSGDSVTCNGNSMSRSEFAGIVTYSANVGVPNIGGTYTITLNRSGETPYNSSVIMPDAITQIQPSSGQNFSKGLAMTMTWTPSSMSAAQLTVSLSGSNNSPDSPCPQSSSKTDTAPENGTLGWSSNETTSPGAGQCSATVTFTRSLNGTIASGLSGVIYGQQKTSVTVLLND